MQVETCTQLWTCTHAQPYRFISLSLPFYLLHTHTCIHNDPHLPHFFTCFPKCVAIHTVVWLQLHTDSHTGMHLSTTHTQKHTHIYTLLPSWWHYTVNCNWEMTLSPLMWHKRQCVIELVIALVSPFFATARCVKPHVIRETHPDSSRSCWLPMMEK